MLRTDIVDLINGGGVWALIGSGVSVDSGYPSWRDLVLRTIQELDARTVDSINADHAFKSAFDKKNFPKCFSKIEEKIGRPKLEELISNQLTSPHAPGELARCLVDWPFKGYITVNYDGLLENALSKAGMNDWLIVGNLPDEIRKMSRDVSKVIWHLHGSVNMVSNVSRLIITENDYDDFYLDESIAIRQLGSLLTQHRVVFIGFGFNDYEVLRLLKRVGKLTDPARPIFAFLSDSSITSGDTYREELLREYNIDVIPYEITNDSHKHLRDIVKAHGAFVLPRALRFGRADRPCPSYDPEATGLLIYNELCMKGSARVTGDVRRILMTARVMALLKHSGPSKIETLLTDIKRYASVISGQATVSTELRDEISNVLTELTKEDFIVCDTNNVINLAPKGLELANTHAAISTRLSEQFSLSLQNRAEKYFPSDKVIVKRVAKTAESFLKDCIERRSLGVAMATSMGDVDYQSYHIVALLQELPKFMEQLSDVSEALALVDVIKGVLSHPSEIEAKYIGLNIQAHFGLHIMGLDKDTLNIRAVDLSQTVFLLDSSTLIPFLARASVGHDFARLLTARLKTFGSHIASTMLLAEEVAEHARWAITKVEKNTLRIDTKTLEAATGRRGEKSNAFLEGFIVEVSQGIRVADFGDYLSSVLDLKRQRPNCKADDIRRILENHGVINYDFGSGEGFDSQWFADRDEKQTEIARLRRDRETFKHDRQVKAEAEALIIIQELRKGNIKIDGKTFPNAYFISHTRIIDNVARSSLPITMRPEIALHWVATVSPCSLDEISCIMNNLLWELSERNLSIIDRRQLQTAFSPLISAAKEKRDEFLAQHRALVANQYGEAAINAFNEADNLEVPVILASYSAQAIAKLTKQLEDERNQRVKVEQRAGLSSREREELEILRYQKKLKRQRSRRQQMGTRKKKKKKKKH